jgi:hypothetical protein
MCRQLLKLFLKKGQDHIIPENFQYEMKIKCKGRKKKTSLIWRMIFVVGAACWQQLNAIIKSLLESTFKNNNTKETYMRVLIIQYV